MYRIICCLICLATLEAAAQKGMPSKVPTSAAVNTTFPQHEDFQPSLVSKLKVASGFHVEIAASGLGKPRMMAFNGNLLYITRRDQGDVLLLSDEDNDGVFDRLRTIAVKFKGVHGIALHDGYLYLCSNKVLKRGKINTDGTVSKLETLIKDLPEGGQHGNRTIAFGPDNLLYISVGSDCNDCNETNKESATILQLRPDGSHRRVFARGLRNTIGFDWHPQTHALWGADNGSDWRGDEIPPEELNQIIEGGDYGWPLAYGNQQVDQTREEPVGSTKEAYAKTTQGSVLDFPAHSAPINLIFMARVKNPPAGVLNDALITFHGSWNRKNPEGYKVQRIKFENGKPISTEDFLSGFLTADGKSRFGRPAGLAISPAGFIYVSDDENGVIYKISANEK